MNLSYWEQKTWLNKVDYTIVGSGIVGLSTALHLKKKMPKAKIVILEKGLFPQGASTKNAGFACFGSLSEILQDLESHTSDEVVELWSNSVIRRTTTLESRHWEMTRMELISNWEGMNYF